MQDQKSLSASLAATRLSALISIQKRRAKCGKSQPPPPLPCIDPHSVPLEQLKNRHARAVSVRAAAGHALCHHVVDGLPGVRVSCRFIFVNFVSRFVAVHIQRFLRFKQEWAALRIVATRHILRRNVLQHLAIMPCQFMSNRTSTRSHHLPLVRPSQLCKTV